MEKQFLSVDSLQGVTVTKVECAKTICEIDATADAATTTTSRFMADMQTPAFVKRSAASGLRLSAAASDVTPARSGPQRISIWIERTTDT